MFKKKEINEQQNTPVEDTKVLSSATSEEKNVSTIPVRAYEKYKNIDWKRVSQERVFAVMAEVMLENKRLNQDLDRISGELENIYVTGNSTKDKSKETLESLAQRIAPNLINEMNSGKKFSVIEMQDYIVSEVLQNKSKYMQKILELTERVKSHKELLSELQTQYYDLVEKHNSLQNDGVIDTTTPFNSEDFKVLTVDNIPDAQNAPREQKAIMKVIPLEKARALFLQEDSLIIERVLGEEGLSEFPIVQRRVKKEGISENRFETVISNLEKESIVEIIKIYTFQRNTGLRLVRLKDDVGVRLFKEVFKKEPVKSEMQMIREENDNYEHGYSIKDVLNVLKESYGYEQVSMSRNTNTITVANRTTWIPDIIGINPLSHKKEYFEVEMGTHNEENFNYKLDKALLVTNELKIVTSNKTTADKILEKVRSWYNQKKTYPNMVVKVYTYPEFRRKEEGRFFPKVLEEKNILNDTFSKDLKNTTASLTKGNSTSKTSKSKKTEVKLEDTKKDVQPQLKNVTVEDDV